MAMGLEVRGERLEVRGERLEGDEAIAMTP